MIKKVSAALAALTVSSAAAHQDGGAGPVRVDPRADHAALRLPASVGAARSTEPSTLCGHGFGLAAPVSTTLLLLSEFTAWLSMLGFLTAKESK